MGRAPCCDKIGMKKGKWTAEEDEKLVSYIRDNGEGSWRSLPKNAGLLRCGKSCRLRWINYLKDDLKRGNISPEEESTIIRLQAELGNRWSLIANSLPGRTDNEIKNHWNSHLSRRTLSELNKDALPPVKKKRGRKPKPKPTEEGLGPGSDSGLKKMELPPETITTTKETEATPTSSEGSTEKAPERTSSGEDGGGLIDFDMGYFNLEDFNLEDLWNDIDNNTTTTTNNSSNYNIEDDGLWWPPLPPTASANCLVGFDDTILDQPMYGIESLCQWEDQVNFQQWLGAEFMPRGNLENHLFRRGSSFQPLSWDLRIKIALGSAKGVEFLHDAKPQVIYRDLKTSNILIDSDYNAKLSDFGLAKNGPTDDDTHVTTRVMGTHGYAAPEYLTTGHLTSKSDVYSFGVVLLELFTGKRAIDSNRPTYQLNLVDWALPFLKSKRKVLSILDPRLETYSSEGAMTTAHLTQRCLNVEGKLRPNMNEIVEALEKIQDLKLSSESSRPLRRNSFPKQH